MIGEREVNGYRIPLLVFALVTLLAGILCIVALANDDWPAAIATGIAFAALLWLDWTTAILWLDGYRYRRQQRRARTSTTPHHGHWHIAPQARHRRGAIITGMAIAAASMWTAVAVLDRPIAAAISATVLTSVLTGLAVRHRTARTLARGLGRGLGRGLAPRPVAAADPPQGCDGHCLYCCHCDSCTDARHRAFGVS